LSSTSSPRTSLSLCCLRLLLIYPIYPGMRSTHLASLKTYSSSDEGTITMASRRATRLTLRAVSPAACTEGSCRDAVVGFAVCGHYVSCWASCITLRLSDLFIYPRFFLFKCRIIWTGKQQSLCDFYVLASYKEFPPSRVVISIGGTISCS